MKAHFTKLWRKRAQRASAIHNKARYRLGQGLEVLEDRRLLAVTSFTTPLINVPGQSGGFLSTTNPVAPPDTIGDVDGRYFIQAVNHALLGSSVVMYNKSDGSVALGPLSMNNFAPAGRCQAGLGDPMVAYDHLAQRWVLGQFAPDIVNDVDHHLCVFVSQTSDPTDNLWYAYDIPTQSFPDYPQLSVTPQGYVISTNEQNPPNSTPAVYVLDRENMLQGQPIRPTQRFVSPPLGGGIGFQLVTPADIDGPAAPKGTPAIFLRRVDDELNSTASNPTQDFIELWELKANFENPALSTYNLAQVILVDDFDVSFPFGSGITQPGTPIELDAVTGPGFLNRVQYRNFGSHQTLVGSFTVVATTVGTDQRAGIKWMELRKPSGSTSWQLYQEGTFAPDANEYWMGSIAMDENGNIALGYNVSSSAISATLRYVGREAGDPLGVMTTQQVTLANGSGFQPVNRWGDYAAMVVDPLDDETFWFTSEYVDNGNWATRVAAFRFADSTTKPPGPTPTPDIDVTGLVWNDLNGDGIRNTPGDVGVGGFVVFIDLDRDGRLDLNEPTAKTNSLGNYTLRNLSPGTYDVRVVLPQSWQQSFPTVGPQSITVTSSGVTPQSVDFGVTGGNLYDFGNAGTGFKQTMLTNNGARHGILAGFHLGATVNGEVDASSVDINDGVTFNQLVSGTPALRAGQTASMKVDVRTGGQPRGYLQGWVDFNLDGDFNDPGEKVISDLRLGTGMHNVSFVVPTSATTGPSRMRFRYGWETGLGPNGPSQVGEVEDYLVNVFGNAPQAIDDSFTVPQDDSRLLNVLQNDFASSAGGLVLASVQSPTTQGGTTAIQNGQVLYTPPSGFFGTDSFTYTVTDGSGATDSATVTITVAPTFTRPVAVDDQAVVSANTGSTNFFVDVDVLDNDIIPDPGDTRITSIPLAPSNGAAVIVTFNTSDPTDDVVRYTPAANFNGTDQFAYQITDGDGNFSVAIVTVFVGDTETDDKVRYSVQFLSSNGTQTISSIQENQEFLAVVRVADIRNENGVPGDDVPASDLGVFNAFLDLLYEQADVTLVGAPNFNGDYTFEPEFDTSLPGLIDEAGASRQIDDPFANLPGNRVLFTARFRANALPPDVPGTADDFINAVFRTDPPEEIDTGAGVGDHDTTLYVPAVKVPIDEITYLSSTITVFRTGTTPPAGEGENPLHNYSSANDVNADGRVNTYDVLLVMNRILRGEAEGESSSATPKLYYDTNNDQSVNSRDIVSILTHLLHGGSGEGEAPATAAEAPATVTWSSPVEATSVSVVGAALPGSSASSADGSSSNALADVPAQKDTHDEALAQYLSDSDAEEEDDYFAQLLDG